MSTGGLNRSKRNSTSSGPSNVARLTSLAVHEASALLAEQIGKFTLVQVAEDGKTSFRANGQIDFFEEEALMRVGGAGGGPAWNRTSTGSIRVAGGLASNF